MGSGSLRPAIHGCPSRDCGNVVVQIDPLLWRSSAARHDADVLLLLPQDAADGHQASAHDPRGICRVSSSQQSRGPRAFHRRERSAATHATPAAAQREKQRAPTLLSVFNQSEKPVARSPDETRLACCHVRRRPSDCGKYQLTLLKPDRLNRIRTVSDQKVPPFDPRNGSLRIAADHVSSFRAFKPHAIVVNVRRLHEVVGHGCSGTVGIQEPVDAVASHYGRQLEILFQQASPGEHQEHCPLPST